MIILYIDPTRLFSLSSHDREPFIYKTSKLVQTDSLQRNFLPTAETLSKETNSLTSLKSTSNERNVATLETDINKNTTSSNASVLPTRKDSGIQTSIDIASAIPPARNYRHVVEDSASESSYPWVVQPDMVVLKTTGHGKQLIPDNTALLVSLMQII